MKENVNLLVVGSGGREHAICKALLKSEKVAKVYCAPGNPGMTFDGIEVVAINELNFDALKGFVYDNDIEWTFVGPEDALVAGIVDSFREDNLKIFGPDKRAAQLEGSKNYAMEFMDRYHIPTAKFKTYTTSDEAIAGLKEFDEPVVIKEDGLAAGKGVVIAQSYQEAEDEIRLMFRKGQKKVVLEKFLVGNEYSMFLVLSDKGYRILPMAQDHKRAYDNDEGPNTGGMGAYSPLPQLSDAEYQAMITDIVEPTVKGLEAGDYHYHGILYIGMIMTKEGPKVIEYNVRLGDPETQVVLPRVESDFAELIDAAINDKQLPELKISDKAYLNVVVAGAGYPKQAVKGQALPKLESQKDIYTIYANVKIEDEVVYGNGGRILSIVGEASTIEEAHKLVYKYLENYKWNDCFYRHDIGVKAFK